MRNLEKRFTNVQIWENLHDFCKTNGVCDFEEKIVDLLVKLNKPIIKTKNRHNTTYACIPEDLKFCLEQLRNVKRQLNIQMNNDTLNKLNELCSSSNLTKSEYINSLIDEVYKRIEAMKESKYASKPLEN